MSIAVRHRNDPPLQWADDPTLTFALSTDPHLLARVQGKDAASIMARFAAGHRAYVAFREDEPAAFGWVATEIADIGEMGATFTVPERDRYLWNFRTLPHHRRRGIYPRLLDAIVRAESPHAERFWIAYAPENHASGSGIQKAGFVRVATLSFDAEGKPVVEPDGSHEGQLALQMLQVQKASGSIAPCWRCVRAGRSASHSCREGTCACDYQRAEIAC